MSSDGIDGGGGIRRVLLTGATGFVGRAVLRELVVRGYTPVCLVRSRERLNVASRELDRSRVTAMVGSLFDDRALREAMDQSDAVIHLVGIIFEHLLVGQTFDRIHRRGTGRVIDAAKTAGVDRLVHMSALGARPDAASTYHRSKFAGEEAVRASGLDFTIFQPSLVHGPDGEFMELLKRFACSLVPPVMPYFGSGESRVQPVSVRDVAYCFVDALQRKETIGKTYPLVGPTAYTWKALYEAAKRLMPAARRWKPLVSQPVPVAKLIARTVMKTPFVPAKLKFNVDQVQMSQEDSVGRIDEVESTFGITLRDFEDELSRYAGLIR